MKNLRELTDSSKSYIWELENKNPPRPSAEKIAKIARVLGVTAEYLVNPADTEVAEATDEAFYRKYRRMDPTTKERIRRMVDLWDDDDKMTTSPSPTRWAYDLTHVLNAALGENRFPVQRARNLRSIIHAQRYPGRSCRRRARRCPSRFRWRAV